MELTTESEFRYISGTNNMVVVIIVVIFVYILNLDPGNPISDHSIVITAPTHSTPPPPPHTVKPTLPNNPRAPTNPTLL